MSYDPIKELRQSRSSAHPERARDDLAVQVHRPRADRAVGPPGELAYATPGLGTSTHLTGCSRQTGTDIRHVPYRANPLAMNDVISGQIRCSSIS
jgi:hypothetical protein